MNHDPVESGSEYLVPGTWYRDQATRSEVALRPKKFSDVPNELCLASGSRVLVEQTIGHSHIDAPLSLTREFLGLISIAGFGSSQSVLDAGLQL